MMHVRSLLSNHTVSTVSLTPTRLNESMRFQEAQNQYFAVMWPLCESCGWIHTVHQLFSHWLSIFINWSFRFIPARLFSHEHLARWVCSRCRDVRKMTLTLLYFKSSFSVKKTVICHLLAASCLNSAYKQTSGPFSASNAVILGTFFLIYWNTLAVGAYV